MVSMYSNQSVVCYLAHRLEKNEKKTVSKNQIYPAHPRNHPKKEWTGDSLILLTGTPIKNRRNAASYVPKQLKIFLATD